MRLVTYLLFIYVGMGCNLKSAADYLQEGQAVGVTGNYPAAIELFDKAIAEDPQLKEAYIKKADSYIKLKQEDQAVATYRALLTIDTVNSIALFAMGVYQHRHQHFETAIEYYNKALLTKGIANPADTSNRKVTSQAKPAETTDDNQQTVHAYEIYYNRGMAYYANQQYRLGFFDFETCIQLNYLTGDCNYRVGLCLMGSNQTTKACEAFRIAAQVYGSNEARKQLLQSCR
jgi:tetratricopeptide (TPR) repeat protein